MLCTHHSIAFRLGWSRPTHPNRPNPNRALIIPFRENMHSLAGRPEGVRMGSMAGGMCYVFSSSVPVPVRMCTVLNCIILKRN